MIPMLTGHSSILDPGEADTSIMTSCIFPFLLIGRDLLVDAGRFAYTGEVARKFRPYARGSAGHNILLIDNNGQKDGPRHAKEPLGSSYFKIGDDFDYASNSFDSFNDVDGIAKHIRSVMYVRGEFWVVVDRIITDKPRKIETCGIGIRNVWLKKTI